MTAVVCPLLWVVGSVTVTLVVLRFCFFAKDKSHEKP
jgi:RsiW-degrading membrane proteinase PrsW (M82 family)